MRQSLENADCPLIRSPEVVGDAWSVLIVRQAFARERRFGEFKMSLGVARNTLTVRLRKLVALGVLEQIPEGDGSPDGRELAAGEMESGPAAES